MRLVVIDYMGAPEVAPSTERQIAEARWGKPEEVAGFARCLASDEASYITGATCFIDGGTLRQASSS